MCHHNDIVKLVKKFLKYYNFNMINGIILNESFFYDIPMIIMKVQKLLLTIKKMKKKRYLKNH